MFRRKQEAAAHAARVADRVRQLADSTAMEHADAATVRARLERLNNGHRAAP